VIECIEWLIAWLRQGEVAEFVVMAQYAYGVKGWERGKEVVVPPNATVRFELELFSWSGITADRSKMTDAEMMDWAFHLKNKGKEYYDQEMWPEAQERYQEAAVRKPPKRRTQTAHPNGAPKRRTQTAHPNGAPKRACAVSSAGRVE
jgi:hypothetical protein